MGMSSPACLLRHPDGLARAVDLVGNAVVASQRRKRTHDAVLPHESKTGRAGRRQAKCRETAKVLGLRVRIVGLCFTHSLPPRVHAKRLAIRTLESGRAQIYRLALVPKHGL